MRSYTVVLRELSELGYPKVFNQHHNPKLKSKILGLTKFAGGSKNHIPMEAKCYFIMNDVHSLAHCANSRCTNLVKFKGFDASESNCPYRKPLFYEASRGIQ